MKRIEPRKKSFLAGKLLRLLKGNDGLQESISLQEKTVTLGIPNNNYYNHQKDIKIPLLEAECRKAEALMELQKRRIV